MNNDRKRVKGEPTTLVRGLGTRLRAARERGGLTQAKLATELGISTTALANYESDKRPAPLAIVLRVAEITGADPAELIGISVRERGGLQEVGLTSYPAQAHLNKDLHLREPAPPRMTSASPAHALDRALLTECISALIKTELYGTLDAHGQAGAIVALYDLAAVTGERPEILLRGLYEEEGWRKSSTSRREETGS